ncbi:MAG: ATP-dependent DNA helicase RecG, partial [Propionibacteriaceae bacterium]
RWQTRTFEQLESPLAADDKQLAAFSALGIETIGDLLRHVPRRYIAGTECSDLRHLEDGDEVAVIARVRDIRRNGIGPKARLEVVLTDGTGSLRLTFFGRPHLLDYWQKSLSTSDRGIFAGKVGMFNGQPQLTHPDFVMINKDGAVVSTANAKDETRQRKVAFANAASADGLIGIYRQSSRLPSWTIAQSIKSALELLSPVEDYLPDWVRAKAEVIGLDEALHQVHLPETRGAVEAGVERLIFDEALATQLTMAKRRQESAVHHATPRPRRRDGILAAFDATLPFELTAGQQEVGETIFADLAKDTPMQRLLQGEVGSGKTIVALRAMLAVIDAGGQAAFLAPTEVLARQHFATFTQMLGELAQVGTLGAPEAATRVELLTGSMPGARKRQTLLAMAQGSAGIIVGTHALIADRTQFADLGLVVVDEQHRFGVEQRAALVGKGITRPHVLVMTATPIPRTVAMTVFGDLETSTLRDVPRGRQDVSTTVVDEARQPAWMTRVWARIREEVAAGRQAFVVAPAITPQERVEPDQSAGHNVSELFTSLAQAELAGLRLGLLHGKLPAEEKDTTMAAFTRGEVDVLIATTVIEVG